TDAPVGSPKSRQRETCSSPARLLRFPLAALPEERPSLDAGSFAIARFAKDNARAVPTHGRWRGCFIVNGLGEVPDGGLWPGGRRWRPTRDQGAENMCDIW